MNTKNKLVLIITIISISFIVGAGLLHDICRFNATSLFMAIIGFAGLVRAITEEKAP